jgi:hypothetical protein
MTASYTSSNLTIGLPFIVGNFESNAYTVLTNNNIPAGTPVGLITASGKIIASASTAVDGSQNPIGITMFAINTTATGYNADTIQSIVVEAECVDFALLNVTGLTWTADTLRNAFATRNIHIKNLLSSKGAD